MEMIDPLVDYPVVVGMGPAGLFLARQLHKLGCPVGAIARPGDVGARTNTIFREALKIATDLDEVCAAIGDIAATLPERRIRLYVASDQYLTLLLQLDDSRLRSFGLAQGEIDSFRHINDKTAMDDTLSALSLAPEAYVADKVPPDAYPCVIKWNEKRVGLNSRVLPKIGVVHNREDLASLLSKLSCEGFSSKDVIAQRYIPGNNAFQYSFGGYYSSGNLLAGICVNQVHQYPQGISSCVVEADGDKAARVEEAARSVASELSFSGFLEVECKMNQEGGSPFVLDVNPRPWGWISILGRKFPGFHCVLLGERPKPIEKRVLWRTLPRDFLANANAMNVRPPRQGYVRCLDVFDQADLRPFLGLGLTAIRKMVPR